MGRFTAEAPEPRPGCRGGHVPSSVCLPFGAVLVPPAEVRGGRGEGEGEGDTERDTQRGTESETETETETEAERERAALIPPAEVRGGGRGREGEGDREMLLVVALAARVEAGALTPPVGRAQSHCRSVPPTHLLHTILYIPYF
jgi:hypothetical protein